MNHRHFLKPHALSKITALLLACSCHAWADNNWSYHQNSDSLTNQTYSFAQSPLPRPGLYDDMMLEIICQENKLKAIIEAEDLITSQGNRFNVEYQIDKKTPVNIQMKTFADSKRKGYTEEFSVRLAEDLLTGQSVLLRINTMLRTVLTISIPLDNAVEPIKKVFADCGLSFSDKNNNKPNYSLSDFEQDFGKLSLEQQKEVLNDIKKVMPTIK
ncbi:MAG: hypothetical protein RIT35_1377 [Pseudomonadota bacterium]|jgi:hypothetical protein